MTFQSDSALLIIGHGLTWIIHEYGEKWVEQGFSPAFTARLGSAALAAEVHTVGNSGIASGAKQAAEKLLSEVLLSSPP